MRSSLFRALYCVIFGLSLCACVLLLSPSTARADILDINLSMDELRIYEEPTTLPSEVDQAYMRNLSNYQDFDPQYYTSGQNTEYWFRSQWFDAYDSALNNPVLALYIPLGSSIIPSGYKIRVSFPTNAWNVQSDVSGTTGSWQDIVCSVNSVWVGSAVNTLQKCTASNGGFVAPTAGRVVVVLLNTTGRTGSRLLDSHRYMLAGVPKLYVEIPDPTAQQINDQSVINTEQITTGQQEQTETLMDTNGSDDVMDSENMDAYRRFYDQLGPVGQLTEVANQLRNATNTTVTSDIVLFPGISLMGFSIPAQQVTITDKMLGLVERIRWITTFCFVAMFIRYLRAFVAAVFGTEEIGLWVSRDEDVEVQQDNIRGFRALGRYYNTDVHNHGRIYR